MCTPFGCLFGTLYVPLWHLVKERERGTMQRHPTHVVVDDAPAVDRTVPLKRASTKESPLKNGQQTDG